MNPKHPIVHKVLLYWFHLSLPGLLFHLIIHLYAPDILNSFLFLRVIHLLSHPQSLSLPLILSSSLCKFNFLRLEQSLPFNVVNCLLSSISVEHLGFLRSEVLKLVFGIRQHHLLEYLCVLWANQVANSTSAFGT